MVRVIVYVFFLFCGAAVSKAGSANLTSYPISGTDYCSLWDFTRLYYPAGVWQVDGQTVRISGRNALALAVNSREAIVNGIRVRFSAPITAVNGRVMIPKADALNGLLALLSPLRESTVARRWRVVIDPGHGGENTGTHGKAGVFEKTVTLDIALRVERLLENEGIEVFLTRRKDVYVELEDRIGLANKMKADLFLSVHANWAADASVSGIETYCMPDVGEQSMVRPSRRFDNGQWFPGNDNERANEWLARCVLRAVVAATGSEDRGVRTSRFGVLRDAQCPAALVECGYMSNLAEERRLLSETGREQIAQAIARGILTYLGTNSSARAVSGPLGQ